MGYISSKNVSLKRRKHISVDLGLLADRSPAEASFGA